MSNERMKKIVEKRKASKKKQCDIVIPIYNAFDCLERCIDSVLRKTDFDKCRLILINDKSSDKRVLPLLRRYKKDNAEKIVLLENEKNLGFVKTANRGMRYSNNDVLLLNSDTIVSDGWLDRIVLCGETSEEIATVTPFSNNLTPMKPLPECFRKKGFPDGYNLEWMAELVQKCSMKKYPEIPSAHGFCMYIKRGVLDKVGYFDEKRFGKGYGEENDFCFRCFDYGYKHVLCDDVFVFHVGTQSFLRYKKFHNDELIKKHPEVMREVSRWYEGQDIGIITDNIELAIGMDEKRINVLVLAGDSLTETDELNINKLRKKANIHVLMIKGNSYLLHSFFKIVDLDTAVYDKQVTVGGEDTESLSFKRMVEEIKDVFGISLVMNNSELRQGGVFNRLSYNEGIKEADYAQARKKMLECNLVKRVGKEMCKDPVREARFEQCRDEQKDKIKKTERPTSIICRFKRIIKKS